MEIESGNERGSQDHEQAKNGSGISAMTGGIDFRGKTSSAVARPPLSGRVAGVSSGRLEVAPSIVVPTSVSSVEMVGIQIFMAKTPFQNI